MHHGEAAHTFLGFSGLTLHLKHEWCRFKIQSCALCSVFWLSLHFVKVFPFFKKIFKLFMYLFLAVLGFHR